MNRSQSPHVAEHQKLVWCTVFASLFKFETHCDSQRARIAATNAFERYGAIPPFNAVEAAIRGELTWPVSPE
jgi:hypothetical protein